MSLSTDPPDQTAPDQAAPDQAAPDQREATSPTGAVTVAITRRLEPGHEAEMSTWMSAGIALAERFPGFLGAGWVRPGLESEAWHMLYRFADHASLEAWEHSPQRQWWRSSAVGLGVVEARVERRTGIEGWFDEPSAREVVDLDGGASGPSSPATPAPPPPRWKQAVTIWLAFFPLSLLAAVIVKAVDPTLAVVPRVLVTTLCLTPVMTYLVLPRMTRALAWWLAGEPAPWRRTTSG